ncbi:MAG TPA: DUF721 domain-containing protein [Bacteroidales bacterium]|jgi:predicted nucleic acid-binding Zn ribbon protein|nr:DUF721 domain-containing protein [Bacteroidales bacterium]
MRKNNTQEIKGVIREYIEALGHQRKLKEVNIISSWEEVMGKMIARHTTKIYIRKKVLYVYLDSPVLRNELLMRREQMQAHLNDYAGSEVVEKIILK